MQSRRWHQTVKKSRQIPDKQIDTPDAPDATVAGFDPTPGFVSAAASISGSDEIDIDDAARGIFQVPDVALALFQPDGAAHVGDIGGDAGGVTRPRQHGTNDIFDFAAKIRRR